jgi:hypothetical protein
MIEVAPTVAETVVFAEPIPKGSLRRIGILASTLPVTSSLAQLHEVIEIGAPRRELLSISSLKERKAP